MHATGTPLENQPIAHLVRDLVTGVDHLRRSFADSHGIHQTDFRALVLLHSSGRRGSIRTAGELATALGLSSGAVTYLVERLVGAELLVREADPLDRRKVLLRPTRQGEKLVRDYLRPLERGVEQLTGRMDAEQLALVTQTLAGIKELVTTLGEPQPAR